MGRNSRNALPEAAGWEGEWVHFKLGCDVHRRCKYVSRMWCLERHWSKGKAKWQRENLLKHRQNMDTCPYYDAAANISSVKDLQFICYNKDGEGPYQVPPFNEHPSDEERERVTTASSSVATPLPRSTMGS